MFNAGPEVYGIVTGAAEDGSVTRRTVYDFEGPGVLQGCYNKDSSVEKGRLIEVEWEAQNSAASYDAEIRIMAYDRTGMLAELSVLFASQEVPVSAISAHVQKDGTFLLHVSLVIKNTQQLGKIIKELNKWPDIIEVSRVSQ